MDVMLLREPFAEILVSSTQENIIHASDSVENGIVEVKRFFREEELFEYKTLF